MEIVQSFFCIRIVQRLTEIIVKLQPNPPLKRDFLEKSKTHKCFGYNQTGWSLLPLLFEEPDPISPLFPNEIFKRVNNTTLSGGSSKIREHEAHSGMTFPVLPENRKEIEEQ